MKLRFLLTAILFSAFTLVAHAQKAKLGTTYAQITSASMRTEAVIGDDPEVYYSFNTTWKSSLKPETIFFKGKEAWANCIVIKDGKDISPELINKGSKVTFKTIKGAGKFSVPKGLNAIKMPALCFQVKGNWYYVPVKNIQKAKSR